MIETYRPVTEPARPERRQLRRRWLAVAGAGELVFLGAAGWWPGSAFPPSSLLLLGGACACWAGAAWLLTKPRGRGAEGDRAEARRSAGSDLAVVWGVGVVLRLTLLPRAPVLSDDVYRYLWDGWVQLHGINPYRYPPADAALAALHTSWHGLVNHPEVPTIYPPAAQYAFLFVALLGATVPVAKLTWILFDLGTGWLLCRIARRSGREPLPTLVLYLWCPLLVVETAWSGHLESLGLFWMMLFLVIIGPGEPGGDGSEAPPSPASGVGPLRAAAAGLALALASLTKFAPTAALPPLARRLGLRFAVAACLALVVGYLPYLEAGPALFTGLSTYVQHWRFNEGAFVLLEWVLPAGRAPRWAAGALVLGVVVLATLRRWSPERSLFWILGAGVVLSPTVHPWYVLWLLPFAALRKSRAWLLLSGLVFLGYWGLAAYQKTGSWPEPLWARLCVWVPFWTLLLYDARPRGRQAAEPQGQVP